VLTISELARHAGVSVRTVRHYHQLGLLAEPARTTLGHRSYGAESLLDLRRITALAQAGVPLARIPDVLSATGDQRSALLDELSEQLRDKERQLARTREALERMRSGEADELSPELSALLGELADLGLPVEQLTIEQEMWRLTCVLFPDASPRWITQQRDLLRDDEYRAIYREVVALADADPDDPRIDEVARHSAAWTLAHLDEFRGWADEWASDPQAVDLIEEHTRIRYSTPAQRRLQHLVQEELRQN